MSVAVHGTDVHEAGLVSLALLLLPPRTGRVPDQQQLDARSGDKHGKIISTL